MKRKKNKKYFNEIHEAAIVEYIKTSDSKRRNDLYVEIIGPVFKEMIDKIVFTYKFTSLPNIETLKEQCEIYLIQILSNFKEEKGYKAFSYFSIVCKHWFVHKVKKNNKQLKTEVQFDDISKNIEIEFLSTENKFHEKIENKEFLDFICNEMDKWGKEELKPNEEKVLKTIIMFFKNIDELERINIYSKKAIYFLFRENTGLNTKQILNNLNKFRKKYRDAKQKWLEN